VQAVVDPTATAAIACDRHATHTGGVERFEYFRNVVAVPNAQKTSLAFSFSAFHRAEVWVALLTFLYLDFLDATGTLFSMGERGVAVPLPYCACAALLARGRRTLSLEARTPLALKQGPHLL
jgi:xanthine/uracil/vitamin C permease (AzgA family)